jgi:hypothetical protein
MYNTKYKIRNNNEMKSWYQVSFTSSLYITMGMLNYKLVVTDCGSSIQRFPQRCTEVGLSVSLMTLTYSYSSRDDVSNIGHRFGTEQAICILAEYI